MARINRKGRDGKGKKRKEEEEGRGRRKRGENAEGGRVQGERNLAVAAHTVVEDSEGDELESDASSTVSIRTGKRRELGSYNFSAEDEWWYHSLTDINTKRVIQCQNM